MGRYCRVAYAVRVKKWLWIGHSLRKEVESIEKQAGLEFAGSQKERKNAANPEKDSF